MKNLLTFIVGAALSLASANSAFALGRDANAEFKLNQASTEAMRSEQLGTQLFEGTIRSMKCVWNFARQGGAIGKILLQTVDGEVCRLPASALVLDTEIHAITSPVGTSGTISFSTGITVADIKAATAISSLTAGSFVDGIENWAAANFVLSTIEVSPYITIATTAQTAGKINVFISYVISK